MPRDQGGMADLDRRDPTRRSRRTGQQQRRGRPRARAARRASDALQARASRRQPARPQHEALACAALSTRAGRRPPRDAFAEQETEHQVVEVGRRREEGEPGDAADLDRHRHLVGDLLLDLARRRCGAAPEPARGPRRRAPARPAPSRPGGR
jgi:hypothetical protein